MSRTGGILRLLRCSLVAALFPAVAISSAAEGGAISSAEDGGGPHGVLVIYADDLGYGDVACYGGERSRIPTPAIDGLAGGGMRFTDAHSSSAVCSPSRYTLLTGRYHWRTRLQGGIVGLWGPPLIAGERITIGSLARASGHRTACIGKWHLGWDWPIPAASRPLFARARPESEATPEHRAAWRAVFEEAIPGGPTSRGFDSYFGTDVPNWPPYVFLRDDRSVGIPSEYAAPELFERNQASLQGPALPGWSLEPILPALGDEAESFLRGVAEEEQPFLLYLSLTSPHTPLAVNEDWRGRSGLGAYADLVMETDALVGRVLGCLEEVGLAERTLVLFTSDNGCAPYIGVEQLEEAGHHPSGEWRGYKSDVWEGGHRVPFIVRWPGQVEPGTVCDELVHQADLLRTLAEALGGELPDDAGEDSVSLLPLLRGAGGAVRETSISCSIRGVPSLRQGSWKLIPAPGSGGWTGGGGSQPVQLYDLAADPGEQRNLAAEQPERVARMQAELEAQIRRGRSTPGAEQANDGEVRRYPEKSGG